MPDIGSLDYKLHLTGRANDMLSNKPCAEKLKSSGKSLQFRTLPGERMSVYE